jgi:protein-disulfide isomerase/uncharacterized membrane protein
MQVQQPAEARPVSRPALILRGLSALAEILLSIYQWRELLTLRSGGSVVCAVNETVNCATVWNSPLADRLHAVTALPVAGLGVVWGLTALALTGLLALQSSKGQPSGTTQAAIKLVGAVGVLSCVTFAVASFQASAVCLTCLATYAITLAYGVAALKLLPGPLVPPQPALIRGLAWAAGITVVFHLSLLYFGLQTPRSSGTVGSAVAAGATQSASEQQVAEFLRSLPAGERRAVIEARVEFQRTPAVDASAHPVRLHSGKPEAPVKLVEFTDILCHHCAVFFKNLKMIKQRVPEGLLSVEPRQFPLAAECNPGGMPDPTGVRCMGAKVVICLEGSPDYWDLVEKIFDAQHELTSTDRLLEVATSTGISRENLIACAGSEETRRKLADDLEYAKKFKPTGTPVVAVNGKSTQATPAWLYSLTLLKGDATSPALDAAAAP